MIKMRIKNESDLYNVLDPDRTIINNDVYSYLKSFCTEIEAKKHLHDTLQIISDEPVDPERFRQSIRKAVKKDREEFDRQLSVNHRRAIGLYVIGILFSVLGFSLSLLLDQVLLQFISFFGTMAFRDAVTIHLKLNPDIRHLRRLIDSFADFKVEVVIADGRAEEIHEIS